VTPEDAAVLKQISSTYSQLDGWFDRSKRQPEVPQPESELFEDDKVWPRSPISEMTRLSLALRARDEIMQVWVGRVGQFGLSW